MHTLSKKSLKEKGWNKRDTEKAHKILNMDLLHARHFSKIVLWTSLLIVSVGSILVSIALIPFLIVLTPVLLYITVIILALMLGFLYSHVTKDIGYLDRKHHISASIILPLIAFANAVTMTLVGNRIIADLPFVSNQGHNPGLIGAVFALAFILPYIEQRLRN